VIQANALHIPLKNESVQCVITSCPYWGLRDYGTATWEGGKNGCDHKEKELRNDTAKKWPGMEKTNGFQYQDTCGKCGAKRIDNQLGLEKTPELYVENCVKWAREVWRILRNDGTFFLNLGDSYFSSLQSSDKYLIFREDLNEGELYESAMALRRYMPGLWKALWREEGKSEGNVCELLSEEIQKDKSGTCAREPAKILSSQPVEIYDQNKKEISGKKRKSHSGNGREMRVLWRNGEDVSLLRPYKGRRSKGTSKEKPSTNLETSNKGRASTRQIQDTLLELQCGFRFIRFLHSLKFDISDIPRQVEIYFERENKLKSKDLCMMPARVILALQKDGWYLRSAMPWVKRSSMPESVNDRPASALEYVFLLTKSGTSQYWTHRDFSGVREIPKPDWRWQHQTKEIELDEPPDGWVDSLILCPVCDGTGYENRIENTDLFGETQMTWGSVCENCKDTEYIIDDVRFIKEWKRINLWQGHDYFFDMDAIRKEHKRDWAGSCGESNYKKNGVGQFTGLNHDQSGLMDAEPNPAGRNFRNTDLFYQSLEEPHGMIFCGNEMVGLDVNPQAYSEAHFATFPDWLITPLIKAGTSEKGACPECGASWERVVDKCNGYGKRRCVPGSSGQSVHPVGISHDLDAPELKTIGWKPSCACCRKCDIDGTPTKLRSFIHATQRPGKREGLAQGLEQETVGDKRTSQTESGCQEAEISKNMQSMRERVQGKGKDISVLQQELLNEVDVGEQQGEQISSARQEQIPTQKYQRKNDKSSSDCDGKTFGEKVESERISTSYKRGQKRQQDRKSNSDEPKGTQPETPEISKHELKPYKPVPCIVLDNFGGSGTTKNVADRLGRRGVICELKMEYIEMAKRRCESNQESLKL